MKACRILDSAAKRAYLQGNGSVRCHGWSRSRFSETVLRGCITRAVHRHATHHGTQNQVDRADVAAAPLATPAPARPRSSVTSTPAQQPPLPLSEQLRAIMRRLTHSVVVCTTALPPSDSPADTQNRSRLRGMTMSSFTSLALHPSPAVAVNVAATPRSRTLEALQASRTFNVHVLAGSAAGAAVAHRFTRGNAGDAAVFDGLEDIGCGLAADRAEDGAAQRGPDGPVPPRLAGPGILYVLRCKLMDDEPHRGIVRIRDHAIVLGDVVAIEQGEGWMTEHGSETESSQYGLTYADRRYRQLGRTLEVRTDGNR